jgi:uncharacterized protein YfaP (DUF2135 family)
VQTFEILKLLFAVGVPMRKTGDPARQFSGPYVFNGNNPVNLYDADGRKTEGIIENEYIKPQSAP